MYALLRRAIRQTLYALKMQYGRTVSVYKLDSSTTDYNTGTKTTNQSSIDTRAIVMPMQTLRDMAQGANYLRASNAFASKGHGWDRGRRAFIFDALDYDWQLEDWIVVGGERYDVQQIETLELDLGWLVIGKKVEGDEPDEIIRLNVSSALATTQTGTGVV